MIQEEFGKVAKIGRGGEKTVLDFPPAEDTHIKIFAVVGRYGKEK